MEEPVPQQRRLLSRVPGTTIGPVNLRIPPREWQARVRDISVSGVGLQTDFRVDCGTCFTIQPATSVKLAVDLQAEVRHVTRLSDGTWLLGCKFSRFLTTDDMAALGRGHVEEY